MLCLYIEQRCSSNTHQTLRKSNFNTDPVVRAQSNLQHAPKRSQGSRPRTHKTCKTKLGAKLSQGITILPPRDAINHAHARRVPWPLLSHIVLCRAQTLQLVGRLIRRSHPTPVPCSSPLASSGVRAARSTEEKSKRLRVGSRGIAAKNT